MKYLKSYLYRMGFLGSEFSKNSVRYLIDMYMTLLAQKEVVCIKFAKTNKRKKLEKELCMIKTINFSVYSPVIIHKLFFVLNAVLGQAATQPVGGPSCSSPKLQTKLQTHSLQSPLLLSVPLPVLISSQPAQLSQLSCPPTFLSLSLWDLDFSN